MKVNFFYLVVLILVLIGSCTVRETDAEHPDEPQYKKQETVNQTNYSFIDSNIDGDVIVSSGNQIWVLPTGSDPSRWTFLDLAYRINSVSIGTDFFLVSFSPISSRHHSNIAICSLTEPGCRFFEHELPSGLGTLISDDLYLYFRYTDELGSIREIELSEIRQMPPRDETAYGGLTVFSISTGSLAFVPYCSNPTIQIIVDTPGKFYEVSKHQFASLKLQLFESASGDVELIVPIRDIGRYVSLNISFNGNNLPCLENFGELGSEFIIPSKSTEVQYFVKNGLLFEEGSREINFSDLINEANPQSEGKAYLMAHSNTVSAYITDEFGLLRCRLIVSRRDNVHCERINPQRVFKITKSQGVTNERPF